MFHFKKQLIIKIQAWKLAWKYTAGIYSLLLLLASINKWESFVLLWHNNTTYFLQHFKVPIAFQIDKISFPTPYSLSQLAPTDFTYVTTADQGK
jgi:hypothetical protein